MGKLVKGCFKSPDKWLVASADFSALEERIGAILSKDPERIKVYTQGYDSHSLRTLKYFPSELGDLDQKIQRAESATRFWINEDGEYCCE